MKTRLTSILFLLLALYSYGFPTPLPKPMQTHVQAAELVMKKFKLDSKDHPPRWRDEAFPQLVTFTTFKYSHRLQHWIPKDARADLKDSKRSWLLDEWGWLITVVMAHDLSQTYTYFVRSSGKVVFLFETM